MDNFQFCNTTKIIFGKGVEEGVGKEAAHYSKKVLLHFGGGSIKKSGLYKRVTDSLKSAGVEFCELGGVKPNPRLSLVYDGIKLCKEEGLGLVLAVGGGSVIDSAKAIAAGALYKGDVWDLYCGKGDTDKALPVGTVLTIPAAGSEASTGSVITKEEGQQKRSFDSELNYPRFSFLNPELAASLPPAQIANGITDIMSHLMERYFTNSQPVELTDRLIEATLKTVISLAPRVLSDPSRYDTMAELMWAGTIAHNNLLSTGRVGDWATHRIEHELSGIYDIAHGVGLAVIFPAWMKYNCKHDINRFAQFATRVWSVDYAFWDPQRTALEGIRCLESFFESIGQAVRLSPLGISTNRLDEMATKCCENGKKVGNFVKLGKSDVLKILQLAL